MNKVSAGEIQKLIDASHRREAMGGVQDEKGSWFELGYRAALIQVLSLLK